MGVKLDFEAVNALPNPLAPATIYYVDHGDGTATQVVTDATGQITGRQVVGLMTAGTLARTGAQQSGAVKTGTAFFQKFTPTRDITLTQVTIQGLSVLSGSARIRVSPNDGAGTTALADAAASSGAGGLTAPIGYTLTAGTPYIIGGYGASLSLTVSSGHTWDGLTQPDTALITSTPTSGGWTQESASGLQMAFLFDVGGQAIRRLEAGESLTGNVNGGVLTLDVAPIELSASGVSGTAALPSGATNQGGGNVAVGQVLTLTVLADATLRELRMRWMGAGTLSVLHGGVVVGTAALSPEGIQTLVVPLNSLDVTTGDTLGIRVDTVTTYLCPVGGTTPAPTTLTSTGGLLRWENPTANGWVFEVDLEGGLLAGKLPAGRVEGLVTTLDAHQATLINLGTRVTNLEARPVLDAEYVQDVVGAMIPGATYDDAAGTLTLPAGSNADAETIRDLVAAFLVAGTNVTITHNDAGDTLTITAAATGGSASVRPDVYGDGHYGAYTSGAAPATTLLSVSGSTTTLNHDAAFTDLTIPAGQTFLTNGYRLFVSGTLTVNGTIQNTGGVGGASLGTGAPGGTLGGGGGTGYNNGTQHGNALGGGGAQGGSGTGAGLSAAQGVATATEFNRNSFAQIRTLPGLLTLQIQTAFGYNGDPTTRRVNGGSAGGPGNAASGSTFGQGGGGGGVILIAARTVTGTGTISARGGAGGAGTGAAGGGGGGGGGGYVHLITADGVPLNAGAAGLYTLGGVTVDVRGGTGGAGTPAGQTGGAGRAVLIPVT